MLGRHIFKHIGENVQISHGVNFTFGYNLTIEDDCLIRRRAVLDDTAELILRKGVTVGEYASVYSRELGKQEGPSKVEVISGAVIEPHWVFRPGMDAQRMVQVS
jgi:serine acetyltransferase